MLYEISQENRSEWLVEGFDPDVVEERMNALLERWYPDAESLDDVDHYDVQRAYEIAVEYPNEIATDIFMQILEARGKL
jgi:hypothetical protein